jgi:hypothetical protein
MSYRTFSTDNADYFLVYAHHEIVTNEDIFELPKIKSLDTIILESGNVGYSDKIMEQNQYSKIKNNLDKH